MKTLSQSRPHGAFTLVEMVGVLAVIAILASMVTAKVFSAINESRLNALVGSVDALKSATVSYYSKTGLLVPTNAFDAMLVSGEYLERPFDCKVGTSNYVVCVSGPAGPGNTGYKLDGTDAVKTAAGQTVAECVIRGVAMADALDLSERIDGPYKPSGMTLTESAASTSDLKGRVSYYTSNGLTTVYIYIGHR